MHGQYDRRTTDPRKQVVYLCGSYNNRLLPGPGTSRCTRRRRIKESLIDAALSECLDQVLGENAGLEYWQTQAEAAWSEFQLRLKADQAQLTAALAQIAVRKTQAARSLLTLADASPEIIEAAKTAYADLLAEEQQIIQRQKQAFDLKEEKRQFYQHCRDLWSSLASGEILNLVAKITVRFEPQTVQSQPWINAHGKKCKGWQSERMVPTSCLIEFKSLSEGPGPVIPFSFEGIVGTAASVRLAVSQGLLHQRARKTPRRTAIRPSTTLAMR
jgi:hypothetical protein